MSKGRAIKMPVSGRTQRGKSTTAQSEAHYLRQMKNLIDGLDQAQRKKFYGALGIDPSIGPTKDEVVYRLKRGQDDISGLLTEIGAEKLPGCGSIVVVSTSGTAVEVAEAETPAVLEGLNTETYYYTARSEHYKGGKERTGRRKQWPGLVRSTVTFSPGVTMALQAAVAAGELAPLKFKELLVQLAGDLRDEIRKATKLGNATGGIEPVLMAFHLIQGCLHVHVYSRDVDVTKLDRPRLGLFGFGGNQQKPRLTLNSLGPSGVAVRRHREAGHQPPVAVFGFGLCRDWRILEASEAHRAQKNLGPCWDVTLADFIDQFWQRTLSGPLDRFYRGGHTSWAKDYEEQQKKKLASVEESARTVLGKDLDAAKQGERTAREQLARVQEREKKLLHREAIESLKRNLAGVSACVRQLAKGIDLESNDAIEYGFLKNGVTGKWEKRLWLALQGPSVPSEIKDEVTAIMTVYLKYSSVDWQPPAAAIATRIFADAMALTELACLVGAVKHIRSVQRGEVVACPELFSGMLEFADVPGGLILTEKFNSVFSRVEEVRSSVLGQKAKELEREANIAATISGYSDADFERAESVIVKIAQGRSMTASEELLLVRNTGTVGLHCELIEAARLSLRDFNAKDAAAAAARASAAFGLLCAVAGSTADPSPKSDLKRPIAERADPGVALPGAR